MSTARRGALWQILDVRQTMTAPPGAASRWLQQVIGRVTLAVSQTGRAVRGLRTADRRATRRESVPEPGLA